MTGIFGAQIHLNQNKYFYAQLLFRENRRDLRNLKTRKWSFVFLQNLKFI